jgi:hypothetical protein
MKETALLSRIYGPGEWVVCWCGNKLMRNAGGAWMEVRRQTSLTPTTGCTATKCRRCHSLLELRQYTEEDDAA